MNSFSHYNAVGSIRARVALLILLVAPLICGHPVQAQAVPDVDLKAVGGTGGGGFHARCNLGQVLTGLELRTGDDVEAIRPLCIDAINLGAIIQYPSWFGGGGNQQQLLCPNDRPLVTGMYIYAAGADNVVVNAIDLYCGAMAADQKLEAQPSLKFHGGGGKGHCGFLQGCDMPTATDSHDAAGHPIPESCAWMAAVGIHGTSSGWVDRVGLICGMLPAKPAPPAPPPQPVNITPGNVGKKPIALGRVHSSSTTDAPLPNDPPICATASSARAKNSPAASGLERQCAAARANAAAQVPAPVPASSAPAPAPAQSLPASAGGTGEPAGSNGKKYSLPALGDGALLWACVDAVEGQANDGACLGLKAGKAYCRMQGFSGVQGGADGALGVTVKTAQPGKKVRAINGDACVNSCTTIAELECAP